MAAASDTQMIEGFLCPICKTDFGKALTLLNHFQEEHSEEQDLLKSFKELFGKAKKIILKQDDSERSFNYSDTLSPAGVSGFVEWEEQELGIVKSHYKQFNEIRNARLQRVSDLVNQLLIRLDKLLDNMPTDPARKKAHEQKVVPWLDGQLVPRCPTCTRSFHLTRRQHHCRLCGAILCHDCSSFLPIQSARKILEKPQLDVEDRDESLALRICRDCLALLEVRQQQKDNSASKRIITQFYERLCEYRKQADADLDLYEKMYKSLCDGETTYNLNDAKTLRIKIIHLAENIDGISGKIDVLGSKGTESPPQGQVLALQKAIRSAVTTYLRTHLLTLPSLPTDEQLKNIRENKRLEIMSRLNEEQLRMSHLSQPQVSNCHSSPTRGTSVHNDHSQRFIVGQGWVPSENIHKYFSSDDPLIQQINIIQNYIKEARKAHKYDEVASLEANLKELKEECWRNLQQQDEKRKSTENGVSQDNYEGAETVPA